jgi:hypothetical protein
MKMGCASGKDFVSFHHDGYRPRNLGAESDSAVPAAATTSLARSPCAAGSRRPEASTPEEGSADLWSREPNCTDASCVWHDRITAHAPRSATVCPTNLRVVARRRASRLARLSDDEMGMDVPAESPAEPARGGG